MEKIVTGNGLGAYSQTPGLLETTNTLQKLDIELT